MQSFGKPVSDMLQPTALEQFLQSLGHSLVQVGAAEEALDVKKSKGKKDLEQLAFHREQLSEKLDHLIHLLSTAPKPTITKLLALLAHLNFRFFKSETVTESTRWRLRTLIQMVEQVKEIKERSVDNSHSSEVLALYHSILHLGHSKSHSDQLRMSSVDTTVCSRKPNVGLFSRSAIDSATNPERAAMAVVQGLTHMKLKSRLFARWKERVQGKKRACITVVHYMKLEYVKLLARALRALNQHATFVRAISMATRYASSLSDNNNQVPQVDRKARTTSTKASRAKNSRVQIPWDLDSSSTKPVSKKASLASSTSFNSPRPDSGGRKMPWE